MASYLRRVLRGSAFFFVGSFVAGVIGYLTRLVLANNLSTEQFGLFYAVLTFLTFFLVFRDMGLYSAVAKFIAEYKVDGRYDKIKSLVLSVSAFQIAVSLLIAAVLWVLSGYLGRAYFEHEQAVWVLRILSLYIPISVFYKMSKSIFQGFQRTKWLGAVEPISNTVVLGLIGLFLVLGLGVYAPVWAYVLSGAILLVLFAAPLLRSTQLFSHKASETGAVFKNALWFGAPLIGAGLSGKFIGHFDTLLLTHFDTLSTVGVYNVVLPSALTFMMLSGAVGAIFMPVISELWAKKDEKRLAMGMNLIYKYVFLAGLPLVLALFAFSDVFLSVLFGAEYVAGDLAFKILLGGVLFNLLAALNKQYLTGTGVTKKVLVVVVTGAVVNVAANLVLIPLFSLNGAAVATAISYVTMLGHSTWYISQSISLDIPVREWAYSFAGAGLLIGIVYALKSVLTLSIWIEAPLALGSGYAAYFGLLYVTGALDLKEVKRFIEHAR